MEQRSCNAYVLRAAGRRPRILVEDDTLDLTSLDLSPPGAGAFEVVMCTGPDRDETCPLVVQGTCPAGRPDVVVSALTDSNPWGGAVRAAWEQEGVPVARLDEHDPPLAWPAHVGAALRTLLAPGDADEDA